MEEDIYQDYSPTVMFRGTPCIMYITIISQEGIFNDIVINSLF